MSLRFRAAGEFRRELGGARGADALQHYAGGLISGPGYREARPVMKTIADTGRLAVDLVESLFGKSTLMRS